MTFLEAKQALAKMLNIDFADIANNDLYSEADLGELLHVGIHRAWEYRSWDFTEGAKRIVITDEDQNTHQKLDYPSDMTNGTINTMILAGEEWKKVKYVDLRKELARNPDSKAHIWAEYGVHIFWNTNETQAGDEFEVFGKLKAPDAFEDDDHLPFNPDGSAYDYSGDHAIILLAYAEALSSDKEKNEKAGRLQEQRAFECLNMLWKPLQEQRMSEQSKNRPFLDVPDYFGRGGSGDNRGTF